MYLIIGLCGSHRDGAMVFLSSWVGRPFPLAALILESAFIIEHQGHLCGRCPLGKRLTVAPAPYVHRLTLKEGRDDWGLG